jgi:hypothetical protein
MNASLLKEIIDDMYEEELIRVSEKFSLPFYSKPFILACSLDCQPIWDYIVSGHYFLNEQNRNS